MKGAFGFGSEVLLTGFFQLALFWGFISATHEEGLLRSGTYPKCIPMNTQLNSI